MTVNRAYEVAVEHDDMEALIGRFGTASYNWQRDGMLDICTRLADVGNLDGQIFFVSRSDGKHVWIDSDDFEATLSLRVAGSQVLLYGPLKYTCNEV